MQPCDYNLALAPAQLSGILEKEASLEPSDAVNCRLLFHKLIHLSENYDVLPAAYRFLKFMLHRISEQYTGKFIKKIQPDKLIKQQLKANPSHNAGFFSGLSVDALVHCAPVFLTEPAWLAGISQAATSQAPLVVDLTKVYLNLTLNEQSLAGIRSVYCGFLQSQGRQIPDLQTVLFARQEKVCNEAFELAATQLALAQFPRLYFAELLGFTLAYCSSQSMPEILILFASESEFGKFLATKKIRKEQEILKVITIILAFLQSFEQDKTGLWERIQTGFHLHRQLTGNLHKTINSELNRKSAPRESAEALILSLLPYAVGHHARIKLEGKPLDDWFKEQPFKSDEFFRHLLNSPLVDLNHPENSRLLKLFEFEGPMFGVLDNGGIEVFRTWLASEAAKGKLTINTGKKPENGSQLTKSIIQSDNNTIAGYDSCCLYSEKLLPDFSKLDNRKLFYYLVNCENFPTVLPMAKAKARQVLNQAKWLNRLPFKPYSHQAFEAYINGIYLKETKTYQPLTAKPKLSKAAYIWGIEQLAPAILTDGSWLQCSHQLAFSANKAVGAYLDKIYQDETGQGVLKQNHPFIYQQLLNSLNIDLPPIFTREFCDHPGFLSSAFDIPVFLMSISKFPSALLPEILGLNMAIELSGLGSVYLRLSQELSYWGINPAIIDVHISIDNMGTGHSALAIKAIQTYLDHIAAVSGNEIMQAHWRRIYTGFCALQTVSYRFKFSVLRHYVFKRPQATKNH